MSTWSVESNLYEIKDILTTIISDMRPDEQLIKDVVCTTYEEYQTLCKLLAQSKNEGAYSNNCICYIVGWVESYRHKANERYRNYIIDRFERIPQHALRAFLTSYQYTLYEYGLDSYYKQFCTLEDIEQIVKKHAGAM